MATPRRWLAPLAAALLSLVSALGPALPAQGGSASGTPPTEPKGADSTLRAVARDPFGLTATGAQRVTGALTVNAGSRVDHSVVVFGGPLTVSGAIDGSALVLGGDAVIERGGHVSGDLVVLGGNVRADGAVGGEIRTLSRAMAEPTLLRRASVWSSTSRAVSLVASWFAVLAVIGLVVLFMARSKVEAIADMAQVGFGRAFFVGIAGELALVPVMLLGVVLLAVTIIGALLIPFAIVAYMVAAAGALALGFLAIAYIVGEALQRRSPSLGTAPGISLVIGLLLFFVLWMMAALLTRVGVVGDVLRGAATLVTWVAVTAGLGATILSRGGTRAPAAPLAAMPADDYSWQTPTPVTGVVAARRPTPPPRARETL